jgi:galactokinase
MDASQESLRSEFELSSPQADALIDLSLEEPSVYGARLAFDGMGAVVVMAVEAGTGAGVAAHLAERCGEYGESEILSSSVTPAAA